MGLRCSTASSAIRRSSGTSTSIRGCKERAERLIRRAGLRFTKHTNAWVPFVIASIGLLRSGGRLGMVVPAELLHVIHAQSARQFLIDQCARNPGPRPRGDLVRGDLTGGRPLACREAQRQPARNPAGQGHDPPGARPRLSRPQSPRPVRRSRFYRRRGSSGKMDAGSLIKGRSRSASRADRESQRRVDSRMWRRRAWASSLVPTSFFLVPDRTVDEYSLDEFALPMFGRSEHVPGVIYDEAVHASNRKAGLPGELHLVRRYFAGRSCRQELCATSRKERRKGSTAATSVVYESHGSPSRPCSPRPSGCSSGVTTTRGSCSMTSARTPQTLPTGSCRVAWAAISLPTPS